MVGTGVDGETHVLGIWLAGRPRRGAAGEGAGFWRSVMADPKNRGALDILIACCDGLAGFGDAIAGAFPRTVVRRCVVRYGGLPVVPASLRELVAVVLRVAGRPA